MRAARAPALTRPSSADATVAPVPRSTLARIFAAALSLVLVGVVAQLAHAGHGLDAAGRLAITAALLVVAVIVPTLTVMAGGGRPRWRPPSGRRR